MAKKYDPTTYVNVATAAPAAPKNYKSTAKAPAAYKAGTYKSQYQGQINSALDKVVNWKYDPMQDANYQALAKVYGARGNIAAKNSLADAAALNGGYGTSYAVSAAQQARNQYNQELAALIPDLENTAYSRATGTLGALRDADDTAYGRFRDTESDRQWKYTQDYQAYRDREADNQWAYQQQYQKYQDALGQYQWARNFNLDVYGLKKSSAGGGGGGGGGGRRGRSGGGGGYSGGSSGSGGSGITSPTAKYAGKSVPYTTQKTKNTKYTSTDVGRLLKDAAARAADKAKKK